MKHGIAAKLQVFCSLHSSQWGWLSVALFVLGFACGPNGPPASTLTKSEAVVETKLRPKIDELRLPKPSPVPGEKLVARLTDLAGTAEFISVGKTPNLSQVLAGLETPYKLVSPYSGLRGETALRVLEVAIGIPNVETYPEIGKDTAGPPRFDPVWNRYRGVYESKLSLLLPPASCYRYRIALPTGGTFVFHTALLPQKTETGKAPVELSLRIQKQAVWSYKQTLANRWQRHEVSLPKTEAQGPQDWELCAQSEGAPIGVPVFGDPSVWAKDAGAAGPNFLLIIVDTLRADALSAMPAVQRFSQNRGAQFSQAITSATWTRPALLSLLGGDLASAIGQNAEDMIPKERDRQRFYALDRKLLPRVLRESGMKVAAIGNNFFLLGYPQIGLSLGFDEVSDVRHPVQDTPAITRAALRFLKENQQRSFFLQLHYDAPHWPYSPPTEYVKPSYVNQAASMAGRRNGQAAVPSETAAKLYLAEAAYADAQIEQVLSSVEKLGLSSKTLVVIVGDHGEVFDIHHNHYVLALKQPTLYHHGWSAYDEILRVPMILAMPGRLPQGVEVKEQVRLFDLAPTVLESLGLWEKRALLPNGPLQQSRSLVPLLLGEKEPTERPAFVEGQNVRALRFGGHLYLRRSDPRLKPIEQATTLFHMPEELYDLASDPFQHQNLLVGQRTQTVDRTLQTMREMFSQHAPRLPDAKLPLLHLALAPGPASRQLHGFFESSDLQLSVAGVKNGEVTPLRPGQLEIRLLPGGQLDVHIDPEARVDLQLTLDGLPLSSEQLLLGPYSLPLLATAQFPSREHPSDTGKQDAFFANVGEPVTLTLRGSVLNRLFAVYPPVQGERGDVLLWRDQPSPGAIVTSLSRGGASTQSEVATVMRDWGYAQPDKAEGKPENKGAPKTPSPTSPPGPSPGAGSGEKKDVSSEVRTGSSSPQK
ncbi:MAG TPA: sulfatase [Pseudomonadota bacterium]|nr:sulfatase [Pseudomonadota bacterium]